MTILQRLEVLRVQTEENGVVLLLIVYVGQDLIDVNIDIRYVIQSYISSHP